MIFMEINQIYKKIKDQINKYFRFFTCQIRMLPDFIIIGAMKCGTSSLYNYLTSHPYIGKARKKETHFFDLQFNKGLNWYRSFFPLLARKAFTKIFLRHNFITGEATPMYILHPHAPRRIYSLLPNVKLIILLRNPVDRAYSHYNKYKRHLIKLGKNYLSYEEYMINSIKKLNQGLFNFREDTKYENSFLSKESVFARGIYVNQIKRWHKYFPKEQILILKSEDLFNNSRKTLEKVFRFLTLPNWELNEYKKFGKVGYPEMDLKMKEKLYNLYKPYNQQLFQYLGLNFNWE